MSRERVARRFDWKQLLLTIEPHPRQHFKLKAIAVGLAFLLWAGINSEEPIQNTIQSAPVELVGVPADLAVTEEYTELISVTVRGRQARVQDLNPADLRPRVDLSDAHQGENIIALGSDNVRVPTGIELVRLSPDRLVIELDQRVEALRDVLSSVEGEPAPGYEITGRRLEPERTWIVGPQGRVAGIDAVRTETVNVTGLRESVTQRVALLVEDPFVELSQEREVQLHIEIAEVPVQIQYDDVPVEVINASTRVLVNPDRISVVVSGPPSALDEFGVDNIRAVVDVDGLAPRADDYLLEPRIGFEPEELESTLQVVAIAPQQRLNVHVYDRPAELR